MANVEEKYEWILIGLSAICLIIVSTFYLYDKVNEAYREKLESQVMQERILMHENQLELMKQSQENIGSLWHDMKNHLLLLDTYLKDKDYEGASKYIANIEDYMHVPGQYVNSGNHEVDAILNYRLGKAEKMGCRIVTKLKVPDCSFMLDFDLNMILGNLLDNALEALEHVDDKYLSVELTYKKGILLIHINNTFDGTIRHSGGEFLTRKKDRENHGMGLRNVGYIVKKYNGEQNIQTSKSIFRISIILYLKNQ
ncbi:MAG: ATP-binding protein [Lachnospiraceae bacterium]|nr:ATP-binding protein [Lachnospiraceae bacterium]